MKTKETYPTRPGSPTPCKQALTVEHTLSYSFVYVVICSQALNRFKAKVLLNFTDAMEANVVCIHCTHVNTKEIDIATVFEDR